MADLTVTSAIASLAGALLVGLLIGAQREELREESRPGLRDFLLVSLGGGACGLIGNGALSGAALIGVVGLFAVFHYEHRDERPGITTELAAVATFVLAVLASSRQLEFGRPLAIGVAIVAVVFLEARQRLHKLLRETITEPEFNGTLAFVAVVLVIYPLLPVGSYGLYSFFSPRQVWMFVILVSGISYVGYFLEKFLGAEKGLIYTSILGGLASTTAATQQFARESRERPEDTFGLWRAFVIANTVQFPRAMLITLVNPMLARAAAAPLAAMTVTGIVLSEILGRWPHKRVTSLAMKPGNPFRIGPALRFGALFTVIVFITRVASEKLGASALYATSLLGGLVDVSTVIAPAGVMMGSHALSARMAENAVLLALASNAVLKIFIAGISGTKAFAVRVAASFAIWAAAGAAAWMAVRP
jgi:uncharacterized membrane protein (DUF4010 family)